MIPHEREEKVQWIQQNLLPHIESRLETEDEEVEDEHLDRSREILAEEYLDEASGIFKMFFKVILPLAVIDSLSYMPPQVYGLVFSTTGTWLILVEADILGSESITVRSMDNIGGPLGGKSYLDENRARRLAHNTVITNIGLAWLFIGFLMQIIAAWAIRSETLIQPVVSWQFSVLFFF